MKKPENVDEYIAAAKKETQDKLKELRQVIKSTVPNAEEGISWGFPFYKYHGILAHFAEYKNHIAIGFGSLFPAKDREMLEKNDYTTGQKRIQIKFNQKVPITMIKQILKAQAKMNEEKLTHH